MALAQTRRSISMKKETHAWLKAHSVKTGKSMSQIVTGWVNFALDIHDAQKQADAEAANRTVTELGARIPSAPHRGDDGQ